jgi:hypothetical protein
MAGFIFFCLSLISCFFESITCTCISIVLFLYSLEYYDFCKIYPENDFENLKKLNEENLKKDNQFAEYCKKENLKDKYPELRCDEYEREHMIKRLSFHDRIGDITAPEKELLEVLKNSMKPEWNS